MITNECPSDFASPYTKIPASLRRLKQWFCWDLVDGQKIPKRVHGGMGKSNDPSTFSDFATAVNVSSQFTGLAFVIQPDDGLTGIDLDNCFDESGVLREWAIPLVLEFMQVAYGEISPSGRGIKYLVRGRKPEGVTSVHSILGPDGKPLGDKQQIECYDSNRFWTMTGNYAPYADEVREGQSEIDWLYRNYFQTPRDKTGVSANSSHSKVVSGDAQLERRARAYLDAVPLPAIGGRNKTVFSVAGHLRGIVNKNRESMAEDEIISLVTEWGRQTGLDDDELQLTARSAISNGTPRQIKPPLITRNDSVSAFSAERSFGGVPVGDIWDQASAEVDWLVDGVFSADQPTILGAKQKTLKTTVLTDLAVALATGTPWLNRFQVPQKRRVLLVTGESSQRAAMKRIRRSAEFRGFASAQIHDSIRLETAHFPNLPSLQDCVAIRKAVIEHEIEVVILDPLYMGLGGINTANLNEVGPAMRMFKEYSAPASVIIAHHIKKSAKVERAPELDDLSQAGIAEFAGNYWLMGRLSEYQGGGVHHLAVRFGGRDEQFGLLSLTFDENSWQASIESLDQFKRSEQLQKHQSQSEKMQNRIRSALEGQTQGRSLSSLADECGTKKGRPIFQDSLDKLQQSGELELLRVRSGTKYCEGAKLTNELDPDRCPDRY